jgi:hypothetical protein
LAGVRPVAARHVAVRLRRDALATTAVAAATLSAAATSDPSAPSFLSLDFLIRPSPPQRASHARRRSSSTQFCSGGRCRCAPLQPLLAPRDPQKRAGGNSEGLERRSGGTQELRLKTALRTRVTDSSRTLSMISRLAAERPSDPRPRLCDAARSAPTPLWHCHRLSSRPERGGAVARQWCPVRWRGGLGRVHNVHVG